MLSLEQPLTAGNATPVCGLLLYKISCYGEFNDTYFATNHQLDLINGRPQLGVGKLLRESDLTSLLSIMKSKVEQASLLPECVLGHSSRHLSWYVKGEKRTMWFIESLGVKNNRFEVQWPNLIFTVLDNNLHVCTYAGSKRPNASTKLYHAPLMNIYDSTRVCRGNATTPEAMDLESIPDWESVIFDTRFSHINETLPLNTSEDKINGDAAYLEYFTHLSKTQGSIPARHLKSLNTNLEGYIQWLLNK